MKFPGPRHLVLFASAAILLTGCVTQKRYQEAIERMKEYKGYYEGMKGYQEELEAQNRDLKTQLSEMEARGGTDEKVMGDINALAADYRKKIAKLEEGFYQQGGSDFSDDSVEIFRTAEGEVYRIKDAILFSSGSDQIKGDGAKLVTEIARQIADSGNAIRVEGHTDSDPVVKSIKKFPLGNLQLSTARALQVANQLKKAGIPGERISVAGYGPWRPIAANDTAENKKRNRRVEIVVLN